TPSKSGFTFTPSSRTVTINGGNAPGVNFTAQAATSLKYPYLRDITPPGALSIVGTGSSREIQYTHQAFNGGPGPLNIQPVYNPASGNYQGTQYVYAFSAGNWTLANQTPAARAFVFH